MPASFASLNYWGVHGFGFVNTQDQTTWGKWLFEPVGGIKGLSDDEAKAKGTDFLFADLRQRVDHREIAGGRGRGEGIDRSGDRGAGRGWRGGRSGCRGGCRRSRGRGWRGGGRRRGRGRALSGRRALT